MFPFDSQVYLMVHYLYDKYGMKERDFLDNEVFPHQDPE